MLWTDLRILVVDTGRVCWRLLPQILGIYLLGWLGSQLALKIAVIARRHQHVLGPGRSSPSTSSADWSRSC